MKLITGMAWFVAVSGLAGAAWAADNSSVDRAFVAKVSQGGMFEVEASKVAVDRAVAQDVKDFANSEVHDHKLVGDKLKAISSKEGVPTVDKFDADFMGKLDRLKGLSGSAFDAAYMQDMAATHAKDGAAFAKEAAAGASPDYRAFAAETHVIVQRHIGAIHAAPPPAK